MSARYQDPNVSLCLNKASFLDPRFKTLTHLSQHQQEEVIRSIADELLLYISIAEEEHYDSIGSNGNETVTEVNEASATVPTKGTPYKKHKLTLLEKLLGRQFEDPSVASGAAAVTRSGVVLAEISHYKGTPTISLRDKPLQWWKLNKHIMPNLAKLAQKYLGIVATSVPSERLFSVAGNTVGTKRAALLPENLG